MASKIRKSSGVSHTFCLVQISGILESRPPEMKRRLLKILRIAHSHLSYQYHIYEL